MKTITNYDFTGIAGVSYDGLTMKNLILLLFLATISHAGVPVVPAADQAPLLESSSPRLAANKRLAYDFFRIVLRGRRLERAGEFLKVSYIQHNPEVATGLAGFLDFFSHLPGGPRPIPDTLPGLVAIQAEGDLVTLSFVDEHEDPAHPGQKFTTTWFDMFRIDDGMIAEHWDCDATPPPAIQRKVHAR